MIFKIQLGNIKKCSSDKRMFNSIYNVFSKLTGIEEEAIFLFVNSIPIRFDYQKDLSTNFNEILAMTWLLQKETSGATKVKLNTQILSMNWNLFWQEDELIIKANFQAKEELFKPYAKALNQTGELTMSKKAFLSEWKTLLHQLLAVLEKANVQIQDGKERRKLELLKKVESQIEGFGVLYTK